jgi:hypothetical protein
MGFFSNIKNRARQQVAPVMPMAPQPMQELRAGTFMPNSPQVGRRPSPPRMPAPPAVAPDISMLPRIPKTEEEARMFRMPKALPPRRGPMNRGIPGLMNQMEGQPRMMMAVGGPLMGRAANISRQVLSRNAGRNLPDRAMPGIGDRIFGSVYNPRGSLFSAGQQANRIKNTENAIIAGGAGGAALLADGTQMFREPFSKENIGSFMSPEAFGKDMAQMRMDVGAVINFARNKANEVGADINEYVSRARSAYDQEMENQRMQEIDAQQGMQPFSMLMGPNMPLSNRDREILGETGRTISDMDRGYIDDILSSLEKKN